jgi:hypothetical protein
VPPQNIFLILFNLEKKGSGAPMTMLAAKDHVLDGDVKQRMPHSNTADILNISSDVEPGLTSESDSSTVSDYSSTDKCRKQSGRNDYYGESICWYRLPIM